MVSAPDHLVDTGILLRISRRSDPDYETVNLALESFSDSDAGLYYTHQNMAEVWNVCTRPVEHNGFGLSIAKTTMEIKAIERRMSLLSDGQAVYQEWRRLVETHSVLGKQVHDARLVAAMIVHGVTHLLTLNTADFKRYPEITAVHPRQLA
jgi:predicted nucleic acid-binding protein